MAIGNKNILVVEDDTFLIKVYTSKLAHEGFEVVVARDGVEAETLLKDFKPDIILLDLMMPKKDGFEVLKDLKAKSEYKNIPVVVTTNLSQPEDKQKALSLGAAEYIVKSDMPIQEVVEVLKKYTAK